MNAARHCNTQGRVIDIYLDEITNEGEWKVRSVFHAT